MSDDISSSTALTITFDDFVSFANAKGISNACPSCGTQSWVVSVDVQDSYVPAIIAKQIPDNGSQFSLPVVLNECENCGYIRLFQRDKIESYIKERGAKAKEAAAPKVGEENE